MKANNHSFYCPISLDGFTRTFYSKRNQQLAPLVLNRATLSSNVSGIFEGDHLITAPVREDLDTN